MAVNGGGVLWGSPESELMDFGEESDVVTNELTDEDDIGFKVIRSLFFIGGVLDEKLVEPTFFPYIRRRGNRDSLPKSVAVKVWLTAMQVRTI